VLIILCRIGKGMRLGILLLFVILLIVVVAGVGGGYGWSRVRRDVQLLQCRQGYTLRKASSMSEWNSAATQYSSKVQSYRSSTTCPAPPKTAKRVVVYLETWGPPIKKSTYQTQLFPYATHIMVAFATNYYWDPTIINPGSPETHGNNTPGKDCSKCIHFATPLGYDSHQAFITDAKKVNPKIKLLMSYGGQGMGCCPLNSKLENTGWESCKDGTAHHLIDCMQHPDKYAVATPTGCSVSGTLGKSSSTDTPYDGIDLDYEIHLDDSTTGTDGILYNLTQALGTQFSTMKPKPLLTHVPMNYFFEGTTKYAKMLSALHQYIDFISIQYYNSPPLPQNCTTNCSPCCLNFKAAVAAMGGDASKVVPLVCNAGVTGCSWTANGSSNTNPQMTVSQLCGMYNALNPNFGGLGFWAAPPMDLAKALKTALDNVGACTNPCTKGTETCMPPTPFPGGACPSSCWGAQGGACNALCINCHGTCGENNTCRSCTPQPGA
jgi:hypothetical protein